MPKLPSKRWRIDLERHTRFGVAEAWHLDAREDLSPSWPLEASLWSLFGSSMSRQRWLPPGLKMVIFARPHPMCTIITRVVVVIVSIDCAATQIPSICVRRRMNEAGIIQPNQPRWATPSNLYSFIASACTPIVGNHLLSFLIAPSGFPDLGGESRPYFPSSVAFMKLSSPFNALSSRAGHISPISPNFCWCLEMRVWRAQCTSVIGFCPNCGGQVSNFKQSLWAEITVLCTSRSVISKRLKSLSAAGTQPRIVALKGHETTILQDDKNLWQWNGSELLLSTAWLSCQRPKSLDSVGLSQHVSQRSCPRSVSLYCCESVYSAESAGSSPYSLLQSVQQESTALALGPPAFRQWYCSVPLHCFIDMMHHLAPGSRATTLSKRQRGELTPCHGVHGVHGPANQASKRAPFCWLESCSTHLGPVWLGAVSLGVHRQRLVETRREISGSASMEQFKLGTRDAGTAKYQNTCYTRGPSSLLSCWSSSSSFTYFPFQSFFKIIRMHFFSLPVVVSFLLACSTVVTSSPTAKQGKKNGAIVSGLGLPISNPDAANIIPNSYLVVYNANATDSVVEAHQTSIMSAMRKRSLSTRGTDGRILSTSVQPYSIMGWRAMALEAEDAMIIDIASNSDVKYVEADTKVQLTSLVQQTNAPLGLERISHKAASTDGYVFDNSAGSGITVYVVDTGIRTTHSEFAGRATWGTNTVNTNVSLTLSFLQFQG